MKHLILFFISIFLLQELSALPIKGIIKDSKTGEEIIGATVSLKEHPTRGTTTGLDGSFVIDHVKEYPVTLVFGFVGYKGDEIIINDDKSMSTLMVLLEPAHVELGEVVIVGDNKGRNDNSARNIEKLSTNILNVVSARAMEISPDLTVANVIQRVSGVTIERNNSGDGQYAILRGMDKRYNYTTVNGVKIPSPDNKTASYPSIFSPQNYSTASKWQKRSQRKWKAMESEGR